MSSNKLPDTEIFCKNLKFLINTEGVSQRNLAAEMGMSESNLSRILKRVSSPSHDQLVFIAERFGVSLNWLMRGIEPMLLKDISTGGVEEDRAIMWLKDHDEKLQAIGAGIRGMLERIDALERRLSGQG